MPVKTRFGLIGAGRIGCLLEKDPLRNKPCTHIGAINYILKKNKNLEWKIICDSNPDNLSQAENLLQENYRRSSVIFTPDISDVIAARPDILVISTNTDSHYDIAMHAMKNNIRRIVLEKPVSMKYREAQKLYKTSEKNNAHVWVNYERRYHFKYLTLKNIINVKKFGKAIHYRGWFASPHKSFFPAGREREGVLLHDTTHMVDLAQFLFGSPVKWTSLFSGNRIDSGLHEISFYHSKELTGKIVTTIGHEFFNFEIEVIFEKARIFAGNGFFRIESSQKSKYYKNFFSLSEPRKTMEKKAEYGSSPFVKMYEDVISDKYDPMVFRQACENIRFLT